VALETAFGELSLRLERLHDALLALRLAVVEDKPLEGAGALLDRLGEAALDLEGRCGEALGWVHQGQRAVQYPVDFAGVRQTLAACHAASHQLRREFSTEIGSCRRVVEIASLEGRGGEWASWSRSVRDAIDQCQALGLDVEETLFECWKEMAGVPPKTDPKAQEDGKPWQTHLISNNSCAPSRTRPRSRS
jgi:hypothetical protein